MVLFIKTKLWELELQLTLHESTKIMIIRQLWNKTKHYLHLSEMHNAIDATMLMCARGIFKVDIGFQI